MSVCVYIISLDNVRGSIKRDDGNGGGVIGDGTAKVCAEILKFSKRRGRGRRDDEYAAVRANGLH